MGTVLNKYQRTKKRMLISYHQTYLLPSSGRHNQL